MVFTWGHCHWKFCIPFISIIRIWCKTTHLKLLLYLAGDNELNGVQGWIQHKKKSCFEICGNFHCGNIMASQSSYLPMEISKWIRWNLYIEFDSWQPKYRPTMSVRDRPTMSVIGLWYELHAAAPCIKTTSVLPLLTLEFKALRPEQNGRCCADVIFKCIFMNEIFVYWIQVSLEFLPWHPIDNKSALVQVMAWHRTGDKPLPDPMMTDFTDAYEHHWASVS